MSRFIASDHVVQEGGGQCQHCALGVTNVLVEIHEYTLGRDSELSARRCWFTTHPEAGGFRMHECSPDRSEAAHRGVVAALTVGDRRVRRAYPATVSSIALGLKRPAACGSET